MAENWKFIDANKIYAYPSANANDGGDINSEKNVTGISWSLIEKNFVIKKTTDTSNPLNVTLNSGPDGTFSIAKGACIINGYYIQVKEGISGTLADFLGSFNNAPFVSIIHNDYILDNVSGKYVPDVPNPRPLPKLHIVFKLVKDTTGNIKGDLVQLTSAGAQTICEGVTWSILTDDQVEELDTTSTPYIDIASIFVSVDSTSITGIEYIEIPEALYSYIDIDAICHGDQSFEEYTDQVDRLQDSYNELSNEIDNIWEKVYPVGSFYISMNATDPHTLFGGTWTQVGSRFLVGVGPGLGNTTNFYGEFPEGTTIPQQEGERGGEVWHQLTENEMPSHTHTQSSHKHGFEYTVSGGPSPARAWGYTEGTLHYARGTTEAQAGSYQTPYCDVEGSYLAGTDSQQPTIQNTGGNAYHNNIPPYLAVYMWYRTA